MSVLARRTKLGDLIKKFLKAGIDSYNSNDLSISDTDTDSDTLGERARLVLNLALGTIYGLIKDSKYLEAYPTTALASTIDQDYIQLDIVPEIDDVETVADTTNDRRLLRRSWSWYKYNYPDPSAQTGTPNVYIVRNDRLYLAPRASSVINYIVDFRKLTDELKLDSDVPLIPTQYDGWIIQEAKVKWYEMEDPTSVPPLIISERDDIRQISLDAILTGFDYERQAASHFNRTVEPRSYGYERPVNGG
jgi:hypothetical protein